MNSVNQPRIPISNRSTASCGTVLTALSPVRYVYKNSRDEEYMGFIDEDVPDIVASNDRKSLSPMDIVAVLTAVVKNQQMSIEKHQKLLSKQNNAWSDALAEKVEEISSLQKLLASQEQRILQMEMTIAQLLRNLSTEDKIAAEE